ncbi:hypothetical protein, partial [Nocardia cyriacigeorgica]|uniref:hypothetical protein n=1 Tax=Nocardia cyriacigeorgica TaxID=135487 RepID=UPI002453F811
MPSPEQQPILRRYPFLHRLLLRATDPDPLRRFPSAYTMYCQLAGWLHTLRQPVQILIRSARLDLTEHITGLHSAAAQMSADLAAAA